MVKRCYIFLQALTYKSIEVKLHKVFSEFFDRLADDDNRKVSIREFGAELKKDINKGRFIRRDKPYPDRYRKLDVKNLFVYEIGSDRLIYTIRTTTDTKIYQFLDYLRHTEYDMLFENKRSS